MKTLVMTSLLFLSLATAGATKASAQASQIERPRTPGDALIVLQTTFDKMRWSGLYSGSELATILEPMLEKVTSAKIVVETEYSLATDESVAALRSVIDAFCTVQSRIKSDQLKTAYAPYAEQVLVAVYTLRRQVDYKGTCGSVLK